jgi:hypothetical protein
MHMIPTPFLILLLLLLFTIEGDQWSTCQQLVTNDCNKN